MSVDYSIRIFGLRRVDENHKKMVGVLKACQNAGLDLPEEARMYFTGQADGGEEVDDITPDMGLRQKIPTELVPEITEDFVESAITIDPKKIPEGISKILVQLHVSY